MILFILKVFLSYENLKDGVLSHEADKLIFQEVLFSSVSIIIIGLVSYLLYWTINKQIIKIDDDATEYAYTDGLTGLYNRHYLSYLIDTFHVFSREDNKFAVVFIDIDNFKEINDVHGHMVGDCILKQLTRNSDVVCCYGG